MMGARYTEAQWQAIIEASLLTDLTAAGNLRNRLGSVLAEFGYADVDNQLMRPAGPKARSWEKVAKSAARLAREIRELEARTLPTGFGNVDPAEVECDNAYFDDLLDRLQSLEKTARQNEARYDEHAALHGGRKDPTRQFLFENVLSIWADVLGHDLAYSRSGGGKPGGPLVRFLEAALGPVLRDRLPTAEGFASIIDREDDRRQASGKTQEVI
jgi:hypothetical protein